MSHVKISCYIVTDKSKPDPAKLAGIESGWDDDDLDVRPAVR